LRCGARRGATPAARVSRTVDVSSAPVDATDTGDPPTRRTAPVASVATANGTGPEPLRVPSSSPRVTGVWFARPRSDSRSAPAFYDRVTRGSAVAVQWDRFSDRSRCDAPHRALSVGPKLHERDRLKHAGRFGEEQPVMVVKNGEVGTKRAGTPRRGVRTSEETREPVDSPGPERRMSLLER